ncbi:MAG: acyltransferase [Pseudomonadota bacterium]|nr:acyltransferase [Pseudomonadota bacterium]
MNNNVQALRALAAYGVVLHHMIFSLNPHVGAARFDIDFHMGATGVDVFFVISGFIMAETTHRRSMSPAEFIQHRLARIVPVYWLLTVLTVTVAAAGFSLFGHSAISARAIVRALLFIPDIDAAGRVIAPILFVGWTLNYEMLFYALFALCLFIPRSGLRLWAVCGAVVALWLAGLLEPGNPYLAYWSKSIILEFALGVAVWRISQASPAPPAAAAIIAAAAIMGLALPDLIPDGFLLRHKVLILAPAAAALVYTVVSLETARISVGDGALRLQGDASYSLYLLHPFVLLAIGKLAIMSRLNTTTAGLCVTLMCMFSGAVIAATAFHLIVERPLTRRIRIYAGRDRGRLDNRPLFRGLASARSAIRDVLH